MKLKVGIIGVGVIGTTKHITTLKKIPEVEITALCDIDPQRCEDAKTKFELPNASVYKDYRGLNTDKNVDIVHICTPNTSHCEMTLDAFANGKHVHCEKPMALTYTDSQKMIEAQKKAGKKLTVGLQWRFSPQAMYVRSLAKEGYFGDIYYLKSTNHRLRRFPAYGVYHSKKLNGGGIALDGGPHAIDLPMWITGNYSPESIRAVFTDRMKDATEGNILGSWNPEEFDVEDSMFALLTMKNGAVVYVETSWIMNMIQDAPGMSVALAGTKAGADMTGPGMGTGVRLNQVIGGKIMTSTPLPIPGPPNPHDNNMYELRRWIDAILYDKDPAVLPEEAAIVTKIIDGVYESAQTGKTVIFS